MTRLSTFSVHALATDAAHSVTASGSVGGDAHNICVITHAIKRALELQSKKRKKRKK